MTTQFVAVQPTNTVQQAIETVRKVADDVETIYYAYAVDEGGHLLGHMLGQQRLELPVVRA